MALHRGLLKHGFKVSNTEKHFHDHDETWLILSGKGWTYWIDHTGRREDFEVAAGDVWMIPAGYEHGSDGQPATGCNSDDFTLAVVNGTLPSGSHNPGHYYVEREGYIPSLELKRISTNRYLIPTLPPTMKGIMFVAKGRAELIEEDTPIRTPDCLLCQTLYTGLTNGTERNVMMGGNYSNGWPARTGYQNVGRVLAVGFGVKEFQEGDLIFQGDFQQHRQYFNAPTEPKKLTIKLPDSINLQHAALFGVASVALHDVRRAALQLGNHILIVGAGLIGQFTAQAARACGAIVTICDTNRERLQIAHTLKAHHALVPDAEWSNIRELGPFDCVFEDSGALVLDNIVGPSWNQGILKPRGQIVMVAGRTRVDYNFNAAQGHEITVAHASHFTLDDLCEVSRLYQEEAICIEPLVSDLIPYRAMPSLYDRLRDKPHDLLGVIFDWK